MEDLKQDLVNCILDYNRKGWSPATSTNYSFRLENPQDGFMVSRSGIDKSLMKPTDFTAVDLIGRNRFEGDPIPSAETTIHAVIYQIFPDARVILHSHGEFPVLVSLNQNSKVAFKNLELLKGFEGVKTHLQKIHIPIIENSQNMSEFKEWLLKARTKINHHCFLIRGHGAYAWGKNLFEAKRHLETLDYLCKIKWLNS